MNSFYIDQFSGGYDSSIQDHMRSIDANVHRSDAQLKARKRATRAEKQERIDLAYQLLKRGLRKYQIKKEFYARYGVSYRTVERYLADARLLSVSRAHARDINRG